MSDMWRGIRLEATFDLSYETGSNMRQVSEATGSVYLNGNIIFTTPLDMSRFDQHDPNSYDALKEQTIDRFSQRLLEVLKPPW